MSRTVWIMLAAGGSAALLLAAFAFQHIGGLPPCSMCLWQRWPHAAAVVLGLLAFALGGSIWAWIGAGAALTTSGIGVYHTGVERGFWEGPSTCTASDVSGLSTDDLFDQIMAAPLVRCDEVAWEALGLSMASWNALIAVGLAICWMMAARARA